MERILQFADSKTTEKLWIFFSENVRKYVNNAAFSNIYNLFSERVNTIFFLQCFLDDFLSVLFFSDITMYMRRVMNITAKLCC